jgi:hypothetical protein
LVGEDHPDKKDDRGHSSEKETAELVKDFLHAGSFGRSILQWRIGHLFVSGHTFQVNAEGVVQERACDGSHERGK